MTGKEMGNFTGIAFMTIYMDNSIDWIIMVQHWETSWQELFIT